MKQSTKQKLRKNENKQTANIFNCCSTNRIHGKLYCDDARIFLENLPPRCADIIFLDPPFNIGKAYGHPGAEDNIPAEEYGIWMSQILELSISALKTGGALYLYHLPQWAMRFGAQLETILDFRHWIAVSMKNGFARGNRLYPAHYALLYFTKGQPKNFQRPKLEIALCRHCKKPIKDYGGYRKIVEEKGLNLSDVWDDLSPVRHRSTKNRPQNELPRELTDRIVHISGSPGDVLVDPFAGSGSAVISATNHELQFLANDLVEQNCMVIEERLRSMSRQRDRHEEIS